MNPQSRPALRFATIGLNHDHIRGQTRALLDAGPILVSLIAPEDELAADYQRAATAIEVVRHGKDVMVDKPGVITLDQLVAVRQVQIETGRIFPVCFSERFESRATEKAGQLVASGAFGRVIQTTGPGSHGCATIRLRTGSIGASVTAAS